MASKCYVITFDPETSDEDRELTLHLLETAGCIASPQYVDSQKDERQFLRISQIFIYGSNLSCFDCEISIDLPSGCTVQEL